MHRRPVNSIAVQAFGLYALWPRGAAHALGLSDVSNAEANQGLRTALERGATSAVGLLGRPGDRDAGLAATKAGGVTATVRDNT